MDDKMNKTPIHLTFSHLPFDVISLIFSFVFAGVYDKELLTQKRNLSLVCNNVNKQLREHIDVSPRLKTSFMEMILKKTTPLQLEELYKTNPMLSCFSSFEELIKSLLIECSDSFVRFENPWITYLTSSGMMDSDFAIAFLKTHLSYYGLNPITMRDLIVCIIHDKKKIPVDIMVLIIRDICLIYKYRQVDTQVQFDACHEILMALFLSCRDSFLNLFKKLDYYNDSDAAAENEFISRVMLMNETTPCMFNIENLFLEGDKLFFTNDSTSTNSIPLDFFPFLDTDGYVACDDDVKRVNLFHIILIPYFYDDFSSLILFNIDEPAFADPEQEMRNEIENDQYNASLYDYDEDYGINDHDEDYGENDDDEDY